MHFVRLANTAKDNESARDNYVLALTLPNIHRLKKFTDRLSNKPFLIWLLTTPPHLKYVATLPCNSSLIACFLTLMFHKVVWQHMQGGRRGVVNNQFTANLPSSEQILKIGLRFELTELWVFVASLFPHPVV